MSYRESESSPLAWLFGILIAVAVFCLAVTSCTRPIPTHKPESEPVGADAVPRDTVHAALPRTLDSVVVTPHRSLLDKVLGRTSPPDPLSQKRGVPTRIGKKSTVAIYYGPATVTTTTIAKKATAGVGDGAVATAIGKAKGPTAIGDSATATDNTKAGQRGGAAANGAGATATATTVKGGWPWWLWVLVVGGGGLLVYRGYKKFLSV